ncbi:gamma-glutamylcyclotransferase [Pantanalinema rosaneae CENA516]|uniref:gamma-glutamylcyclotransferase n=1 Tax=Pantanalinema rosaneae TaxID=1620701 RepID=UPI003D6F3FB3
MSIPSRHPQARSTVNILHSVPPLPGARSSQPSEPAFYYFAYGSCMCPVDLKRTLGESMYPFVIGAATLPGYRLGFYRRSQLRNCGVLDVVPDPHSQVEGVLYQLPWRLSALLDEREEVPRGGYRHETIEVLCGKQRYADVRTYVVVNKLPEELAPNDWYFNVVLRGAVTCGLPEQYCWQLFSHMHRLQQQQAAIQQSA